MGGGQLKILLAVFALGMVGAAGVFLAYMWEKKWKPEKEVRDELVQDKEDEERETPDLGKKQYEFAIEAIRNDDITAARTHLGFILEHYPDSSAFPEAKRILGELNVDQLLSAEPGPGKVEYTVKRGKFLSIIARESLCTIDYILRANGKNTDKIRIDEKLWVAPLLFTIEINVTDKTLTVYRLVDPPEDSRNDEPAGEDGEPAEEPEPVEEFFKEYPILDINIPAQIKIPLETVVSSRPAWNGSKRAEFNTPEYHNSHRWLQTKRVGILIQEMVDDLENATEDKRTGFLLSRADSRELYTYIRPGTVIRVVRSPEPLN